MQQFHLPKSPMFSFTLSLSGRKHNLHKWQESTSAVGDKTTCHFLDVSIGLLGASCSRAITWQLAITIWFSATQPICSYHPWFLVDCAFIKAPFVTYWQSLVRAHEYLHFDIKSLLYSTEAKFYRPVKHKTIIFVFSPKLIFWCYHLLVLTGRLGLQLIAMAHLKLKPGQQDLSIFQATKAATLTNFDQPS